MLAPLLFAVENARFNQKLGGEGALMEGGSRVIERRNRRDEQLAGDSGPSGLTAGTAIKMST